MREENGNCKSCKAWVEGKEWFIHGYCYDCLGEILEKLEMPFLRVYEAIVDKLIQDRML